MGGKTGDFVLLESKIFDHRNKYTGFTTKFLILILECVSIATHSTSQSKLFSSSRVLHMQRTLIMIQRNSLEKNTKLLNKDSFK